MQYRNKVLVTLGSTLVVFTLLFAGSVRWALAIRRPASALPANWIKGANMIGYAPDPYKIANQHRRHCLLEGNRCQLHSIHGVVKWIATVNRHHYQPNPWLCLRS